MFLYVIFYYINWIANSLFKKIHEKLMSIEEKSPKTIFLLGAGASRDAGIPTIQDMTTEFVNDPIQAVKSFLPFSEPSGTIKEIIKNLSDTAEKFFGNTDLELIMSLILRLEDEKEKDLLETKFQQLSKISKEDLQGIKAMIQGYIRKKCEDIKDVEYLWPLEGLCKDQKLNIFTLNYDGTIEIFCEKKDIKYFDGFDPGWNKKQFDDPEIELNLFKLHGSLYWFRTKSNKTIKVPMKGLQFSYIKYLTDEEVSEMMIYPTLEKNKQLGVYSWLSQKFKDELNNSDLCIVMGYSFRDEDITESIIESLTSNNNLWLIIANPHASNYKQKIFSFNRDLASRVVTMDMNMSKSFTDRNLNSYLSDLELARTTEERSWKDQSTSQTRYDNNWNLVLRNYLRINHHDRVKWLIEELFQKKFTSIGDNFPNCIEAVVGDHSLQYMLGYNMSNQNNKLEIWKKIFVEYCSMIEYTFYKSSIQTILHKNNPVKKEDLPFWFSDIGQQPRHLMKSLNLKLKEMQIAELDETLKTAISKLTQSLDLFVMDNGQLENSNPGELVGKCRDADLGIRKWAVRICDHLK